MAEERLTRARFIRLGAALGVGAAGASVIAACGGSSGGSGEGGGGGGENGGGNGAGGGGANVEATDRGATGGVEGATQASGETAGEAGGESGQQQAAGEGAIASESEVPAGSAVEFTDEAGSPAVLVHLENGDFAAYSAVCTHQQCTVAYQNQSGLIACPCHGSVFDPADGAAVVNGPAQTPLPEIPVEVRNGEVYRA